jgi:hypothetical protein
MDAELRRLAKEIVFATAVVSEKYFELCNYIRSHNVPPNVVRGTLKPLGFRKWVISKLLCCAYAADDLWDEFASKRIGYNKMLRLTRESVRRLGLQRDKRVMLIANDTEKLIERRRLARYTEADLDEHRSLRRRAGEAPITLIKFLEEALEHTPFVNGAHFVIKPNGSRISVEITVQRPPWIETTEKLPRAYFSDFHSAWDHYAK